MSKVLRVLFILVVLTALFVPLMIALKYVAISQIYSYFVESLANLLGVSMYLIRALVILAMVPFLYAIKLMLSFSSQKRRIGGAILTAFLVVYNIGLYYATRDLSFGFQKGEILRWYAETPEGVKFFDRAGVDPVYGIPLKPVTPELMRKLKGTSQAIDPAKAAWFSTVSGEAQLWYYQSPEGELEFYAKPGAHSFTGEQLLPVTKDIYFRWRERNRIATSATSGSTTTREGVTTPVNPATAPIRAGEPISTPGTRSAAAIRNPAEQRRTAFRGLLNSVSLIQGKRNVAIFIDTPYTASGFAPDQALYGQLNQDRVNLITNLFRRDVIAQGFFSDLYDGDKDLLQIAAASKVDYIILGRMQYAFKKAGQVDNELVSCEITLNCKVINQAGDVTGSNSFRVLGPGFSESAAIERGIELLTPQFSDRILKALR